MHHDEIPHATLSPKTIETAETQRTFDTGGTILSIRSFTNHVKTARGIRYTVTIYRSRNADPKENYSLYNLGIQARYRGILIRKILKGTKVVFLRPKLGQENRAKDPKYQKIRGAYYDIGRQPKEKSQRIRRVEDEDGVFKKGRIWFISFEGNLCELEVVVLFPATKKKKRRVIVGHEWAPPPPEPGGENEEEEEKGDPEEEDGETGDQ